MTNRELSINYGPNKETANNTISLVLLLTLITSAGLSLHQTITATTIEESCQKVIAKIVLKFLPTLI